VSITVNVNFVAAPPPNNTNFKLLRVKLTDAGGALFQQEILKADVTANAVLQPDGSYSLPVTFSGVGVGPYTITAQAASDIGPFGPIASGSGTVSLADGVWYASPTSFA
jgi:hypothetical protein